MKFQNTENIFIVLVETLHIKIKVTATNISIIYKFGQEMSNLTG